MDRRSSLNDYVRRNSLLVILPHCWPQLLGGLDCHNERPAPHIEGADALGGPRQDALHPARVHLHKRRGERWTYVIHGIAFCTNFNLLAGMYDSETGYVEE